MTHPAPHKHAAAICLMLSFSMNARAATPPAPVWEAEGEMEDVLFGNGVSSAGDVNGDGYDDIVVTARWYTNGEVKEGKLFLYLGGAAGPELAPAWTFEGNQENAQFGRSVPAGDVNGDGFDDLLVGAGLYDNGEFDEGLALLFYGSPSGLSPTPGWSAEGNNNAALFGSALASAGDINGDGFDDVIVGAPYYSNGLTWEGAAFLYLGSAGGLSTTPEWVTEGEQEAALFGNSVSGAGDINGDGFDDLLVGAPFFDSPEPGEGRVFVYKGSSRGLRKHPWRTLELNESGAHLGSRVGPAGDVDGDGMADIVIGAFGSQGLAVPEKVIVYPGSAAGPRERKAVVLNIAQRFAHFGLALGLGGDVDGDGFSDLVVGARLFNATLPGQGRIFVYTGSAAGINPVAGLVIDGVQAHEELGVAVDFAGDVNGDGFPDIIAGAHGYDNPEIDEGRALVYPGGPGLLNSQKGAGSPHR